MNKVSLYFKENDRQYLLPIIKFELSSENENFGKLISTMVNLTASQYFKSFLMSLVVILTKVTF